MFTVGATALSRAADPSALWHIVDGQCVPHQERNGDPAPCAAVSLVPDRAHGYAVLKDLVGIAQFLVMPAARIGGIEDPAILAPGATNYWAPAWEVRRNVEVRLPRNLTREEVSLAINSRLGRTQDLLHIHVDCVRADVKAAIAANLEAVGPDWAPFPVAFDGHPYRARRIEAETLQAVDPFRLLAASIPVSEMGNHTLVVVGATFAGGVPGFVLFDDRVDLARGDRASGEELQDHRCGVVFGR
ncbi:MAG: CDP-diacylglycerol diphosphatase [Rhodospirillales bacterium]|nr:CDP-diacylglycerol diphosphatase [Rhodospirillales bacterium]MBN8897728.1 CDP-diacylglycerol diphosphatase [Rhodospirillales bacterium]